MKIDGRIINYEAIKNLPRTSPEVAGKVDKKNLSHEQKIEGKEGAGRDTIVNLSQASKEAQLTKEIIASQPDIREEKVASIKEKIEAGSYNIDYKAVADKLVDASIEEIF